MIKSFYAKFPQYRWITFRDMRGLSELEFANAMKESFCSVWLDSTSGFGTYPLESFKMGIPVIGLVPNLQPEWMNENNGIWINNQNMFVDVVADFIQNWLEDNISPVVFEEMEKTISEFSDKSKFELDVVNLFNNMINTRLTSFEEQLSKFETIE
jgi:glycosyltransferase involved in cell wall biosynthesis